MITHKRLSNLKGTEDLHDVVSQKVGAKSKRTSEKSFYCISVLGIIRISFE